MRPWKYRRDRVILAGGQDISFAAEAYVSTKCLSEDGEGVISFITPDVCSRLAGVCRFLTGEERADPNNQGATSTRFKVKEVNVTVMISPSWIYRTVNAAGPAQKVGSTPP